MTRAAHVVLVLAVALAGVMACAAPAAGQQTRVYLAPDDHTDYIWTATAAAYDQAFVDMLDYYMDLTDATAGDPPDYQSRFHADGSYWLWIYAQRRGPAAFERVLDHIRSGHLSVPMNALCLLYGGTPTEAVLRGMYYAGQLERRHGIDFTLAYSQENQTLPLGVASLWAGSGAPYSFRGVCNCVTRVGGLLDRAHEVYWHEGLDGSRVLMKWFSITDDPAFGPNGHRGPGGYSEVRYPEAVIDYVTSDPGFRARHPYDVIGLVGYGWDDFETYSDEVVQAVRADDDPSRRVIVSDIEDYFVDFEATHGAELPTQSVTFGNEWEVGAAAFTNPFARVRRALGTLRAAEALATLVALADPAFLDGRAAARDRAWIDLGLVWEHNIGSVGTSDDLAQQRIDWQRALADEIEGYVDTLYADARAALGGHIRRSGGGERFFVFNPLGHARDDVADLPWDGPAAVHAVDVATGAAVPSQIVTVDGVRALRVLAEDVPPVGYRVYEVRSGAGPDFTAGAPTAVDGVLANGVYEVTVAPRGAVTSLVDLARGGRELVRRVAGVDANDLGPGGGALTLENAGPVSVTLRAEADGPLRHTTRVTLVRGLARVDIENRIEETIDAVSLWSFGWDLDDPVTRFEEVGAVIQAGFGPDGGHYADRNARYDYQTLNHFVTMTGDGGDGVGVTIANRDCHFFRLGTSSIGALDTETPLVGVLAGGPLESAIPDQAGDDRFVQRLALQTHEGVDDAAALRFALGAVTPLVTGPVTGGETYPEDRYSFLTIDDPDVLLWALKPADDGLAEAGIVARLWNLAAEPRPFRLTLADGRLAAADALTHVETPLADVAVTDGALADTLGSQRLATWALHPAAESFPLTVVRGSGSGSYAVGERVAIRADEPPEGRVFASWVGDVAGIDDVTAPETTLAMPARAVRVVAMYVRRGRVSLLSGVAPETPSVRTRGEDFELGVRFHTTRPGRVTAIRFYLAPGETGAHTGRLWRAGRPRAALARVDFPRPTGAGWQEVALAAPVALAPGVEYRVSVNVNDRFAVTHGGLARPIVRGPLRTVAGGNGVYHPGPGVYPDRSHRDANYFVDVVFEPDGPAGARSPAKCAAAAFALRGITAAARRPLRRPARQTSRLSPR